jgi:ferredoxin-type protein NapH
MFHQVRHLILQCVRRVVQVSVIVGLVSLIFLNLYAHYRAARALEDLSGYQGKVLHALDRYAQERDDPQAWLDGFTGTLWSMKVAGVDFTDPLAAAEATAASRSWYAPLLMSLLIPVLGTLLLGRVFCSWICPGYLLFEIGHVLRWVLRIAEIPPGRVRFSTRNKYILLAVGLVWAAVTGLPLFATIYPPAVISRLLHAWIFGTALTGMLVIMGLILLFEVFVSPRWWCRSMCPGGALYGLIGAARPLRVKLNDETCTHCGKCQPVCPMGLNPETQSVGIECDNCAVCIRHCPHKSLFFGLKLPGRAHRQITVPARGEMNEAQVS